jgi:NADH:ubiquinone reductase (non-electrogenic)
MAGSTLAVRSMASIMQLSSMSRRSIATSQLALRPKPLSSVILSVSRLARRSYADAAAPTPSPTPKPKKRFRALRWAWRLTWISAIGLTGAVAYSIFELRQPPNQSPPDPSKKTLVILGRFSIPILGFNG